MKTKLILNGIEIWLTPEQVDDVLKQLNVSPSEPYYYPIYPPIPTTLCPYIYPPYIITCDSTSCNLHTQ